jgi:large repetitive protein
VTRTVALYFEPANDLWPIARSPIMERWGAAAARLADGRVLVAGDAACTTQDPIAELFDAAAGSWSAAGTFPEIDGMTATALLDGRVLLVGGQIPCHGVPAWDGDVFLFGSPST